jgi:hypothetical protein
MKKDIDDVFFKYQQKGLSKPNLYTIRGEKDNIVPKHSTHIQDDHTKEFSYPKAGHGDILVIPEVANKVVELLKK